MQGNCHSHYASFCNRPVTACLFVQLDKKSSDEINKFLKQYFPALKFLDFGDLRVEAAGQRVSYNKICEYCVAAFFIWLPLIENPEADTSRGVLFILHREDCLQQDLFVFRHHLYIPRGGGTQQMHLRGGKSDIFGSEYCQK